MNNKQKICTKSDLSELEKIRDFIILNCNKINIDNKTSNQLALAVDEACTNIINYAHNKSKNQEICIEFEKSMEEIIIKIYDEGKPFNPKNVKSPDMKQYFKELRRGGLGIQIIKTIIDNINYYPAAFENKNILELRKQIA